MPILIYRAEPRSINARGRPKYQARLREAFEKMAAKPPVRKDPLYGFVYYFHQAPFPIDADNLSKPVWDALRGLAYDDDCQIVIRYAGKLSMNQLEALNIDISHFDDDHALDEFYEALNSGEHVVYIEWDSFDPSLFKFGRSTK